MKKANLLIGLLVFFLAFLGLGGLYGGITFLSDPSGASMGMADYLPRLPVPSYTLPGLFLLVVMGLAPFILVWGLLGRPKWALAERLTRWSGHHWAWTGTLALGLALALWLAVQASMIGFEAPIQYIIAATGAAILILTLIPAVHRVYLQA